MSAIGAIAIPAASTNYAIVGQSFAAIVNHLSLCQSKSARIAGHQIVHVTNSESWIHSAKGAIGQWPMLIDLPGFKFTYADHAADTFLAAPKFSECVRHALEDVRSLSPFVERKGAVSRVDRRGAGDYLIVFENGHGDPLPAARIDICMGPGRSRHWAGPMPEALKAEYDAEGDLESFRRVISGEDFLGATTTCNDLRVCVVGDGGTAAWVVEQALERKAQEVVWVGREFGPRSFLSSERNDSLVQPLARQFIDWYNDAPYFDSIITSPVRSASARLILIESCDIQSLDDAAGRVRVNPIPLTRHRSRLAPPDPAVATPEDLLRIFANPFDVVAFAIGGDVQAINRIVQPLLTEAGTLRSIARGLDGSRDGRLLGLQADGGAVRLLGMSAMSHSLMAELRRRAREKMPPRVPVADDFAMTLCAQGKGSGFASAAIDIAEANDFTEYLNGVPDERAPLWLLESRLGDKARDFALARAQRVAPVP